MKHIKSVNEFFGLFKSKEQKECNDIAKEFIRRLEKVKGECPYEINRSYTPMDDFTHEEIYSIKFDDVEIKIIDERRLFTTLSVGKEHTYKFYVISEDDDLSKDLHEDLIGCDERLSGKLFKIIDGIHSKPTKKAKEEKEKGEKEKKRTETESKLKRLNQNINPA